MNPVFVYAESHLLLSMHHLLTLGIKKVSDMLVEKIWMNLDANGSGEIDYKVFGKYYPSS